MILVVAKEMANWYTCDMLMPNASRAIVQRNKVVDYLLNDSHADGAPKADFFRRFGFDKNDRKTLAKALMRHGASGQVRKNGQQQLWNAI